MNSVSLLPHACSGTERVATRRRTRRRISVKTVATVHVCQQPSSTHAEARRELEDQEMQRRALEAAWMTSPPASGSMDREALCTGTAAAAASAPRPMRTRRAHQAQGNASTGAGVAAHASIRSNVLVSSSRSSSAQTAAQAAADTAARGYAPSGRGASSTTSSSSSSSRAVRQTNTSSLGLPPAPEQGAGLDPKLERMLQASQVVHLGLKQAAALKTVTHLWQLRLEHDKRATQGRTRYSVWFENEPPRLLTAAEEAALGSIVQQFRKLLQLSQQQANEAPGLDCETGLLQQCVQEALDSRSGAWMECGSPASRSLSSFREFAANANGSNSSSDSGSSSPAGRSPAAGGSTDGLSSSDDVSTSSSRRGASNSRGRLGVPDAPVHGNTKWPPPLTEADVEELQGLSLEWRVMLPELAGKAQQLLVSYNTRLVCHMLQYCRRTGVPTEDLLAAGLGGLKTAALRYDPSRNTRFSTVATRWILQRMQRTADAQFGSYRTPHRYGEMLRLVLHEYGAGVLADIEQRPEVLQKVAERFCTRPATVLRALKAASGAATTASLDEACRGRNTSKSDESSQLPWAAMLTSTDLDEGDEGLAGEPDTGVAGHGSYMAAAGKMPAWMQQQQDAQVQQLLQSEDAAGDPASQVQLLMQALLPRERAVLLMMYGDHAHELLQAAKEQGAVTRMGRPRKDRSTVVQEAANRAAVDIRGGVPLAFVAEQLGLSVECVRLMRVSAFKKLRAAAKAAGQLHNSGSESSNSGSSSGDGNSSGTSQLVDMSHVGAVEDAIQALHSNRQRQLLRVLQQYCEEYQAAPGFSDVFDGVAVGRWCSKQYHRHTKHGKVSAQLLRALEAVCPGWLEAMQQRIFGSNLQRRLQQQQQQQPEAASKALVRQEQWQRRRRLQQLHQRVWIEECGEAADPLRVLERWRRLGAPSSQLSGDQNSNKQLQEQQLSVGQQPQQQQRRLVPQ